MERLSTFQGRYSVNADCSATEIDTHQNGNIFHYVARQPVVLTRDHASAVHVLFNRCGHRALGGDSVRR